jgi:serine/threonine-protein kinase
MNIRREDWAELSPLLDAALDLPAAARPAWLAALPPSQAHLAPALEHLLSATVAERFSEATLPPLTAMATPTPESRAGQVVAGYRLLELLGQGGMGAVWLAERADGTLRRRVALKLLHPALASTAFVERFARERDILAQLEHPAIARLYDAGIAADGQPYLALEYVDGMPIDRHCDRKRLSVEARLQLFLRVLDAVQYAHGHLVVHRDLKPSNILVTPAGEVRLLDFGIAKFLADAPVEATELTRAGGRMLTLAYASPEQVQGRPVGVASDVYSLGVVLYELLAGRRPYRTRRDSAGALEDAVVAGDLIAPVEAARAPEVAASRGVSSRRLRGQLEGDVAAILAQALRTDPQQRYPTCEAFAADVSRHLRGEVVVARRASRLYRTGRFLRRHWLPTSAIAGVVAALAIGGAAALWQAELARRNEARATVEAARAERERAVAVAVKEFLVGVFRSNDPDSPEYVAPGSRSASTILADGIARMRGAFDDQPETRAELNEAVVEILLNMDEIEAALALARENVTLVEARLAADHPRRAAALLAAATAEARNERPDESRRLAEQAAQLLDARGDRDSTVRARLLVLMGAHLARPGAEGALDIERAKQGVALLAVNGASSATRAQALIDIAHAHSERGESAGTLGAIDAALAWAHGFAGAELFRSRAHTMRAPPLIALGRLEEAEASLRAASAGLLALGKAHPESVRCALILANHLHAYGKRAEGRALFARIEADIAAGAPTMPVDLENLRLSALAAATADGDVAEARRLATHILQLVVNPSRPATTRLEAGLILVKWYQVTREAARARALLASLEPLRADAAPLPIDKLALARVRQQLLDGETGDTRTGSAALAARDSPSLTLAAPNFSELPTVWEIRRERLLLQSEAAERERQPAIAVQYAREAAAGNPRSARVPYAEEDDAAIARRLGNALLAAGDAVGARDALAAALAFYAREHHRDSPVLAQVRKEFERARAAAVDDASATTRRRAGSPAADAASRA